MIKTSQLGINLYANEIQLNLNDVIAETEYEHQLYWYTSTGSPMFPANTRIVAISVVSTIDDDGTFGAGCTMRLVDHTIGLATDADNLRKWKCIFVADGSVAPTNYWEESFDDSEWVSHHLIELQFQHLYVPEHTNSVTLNQN